MLTILTNAFVTAYIATGHVCANGVYPHVHRTIAAPRWVALGSRVFVCGKEYVVEDRTARRYDGRFDIFVATKQEALTWGKRKETITIYGPPNNPTTLR
jgi:3D (Asp-Asp-Asp) domain-containing protein